MTVKNKHKVDDPKLANVPVVQPLATKLLAYDMERGQQIRASGLIMLDDEGQEQGIKARWCRVYDLGEDVDVDVNPGDWILVEHGRWSRGINFEREAGEVDVIFRNIDTNAVMAVSETKPDTFSSVG